ncbi:glycosyltransferase family 4 protein [Trujillonella endophytica]|uniref:Glycosyltransferase involved in cell wall bisynthesis n=1 Tax=Trujillonella endophytica TaxID=673521 RepID=A0A1H8W599_9ACTN|nr:glycosyltransferase family 4 protein [Trujillella endophytica]SEP22821.1 Glycosyltransferase involved in cell wall bisynthesis [Trujillella endophytica]
MTAGSEHVRVLMLTDSLGVGGLERVVVSMSCALAGRGHAVSVAAEPGGALWGDLPPEVVQRHAPRRGTPIQRVRYALWLTRLVRGGGFDVVHAHQRGVALLARAARVATRTRVVEHVHNVFRPGAGAWLSFRGDHLVACGRAVAEMLVQDFRRPADRVTTVRNAVPDVGAGRDLTLPVSRGGQQPKIAVVARVDEQKDPFRFIDVVEELAAVGRPVSAVWIGDGDLLQACRAEVDRRAVPGLRFLGARSDVASQLLESDLVMLTSRWEGLPLTLLEAASLGRGLVAPRVGSCDEAVTDGVNGLLFDVDLPGAALARLVAPLLESSMLRSMGAASRRRYLAEFTIDRQVHEVEEVYRAVRAVGPSA